MGFNVALGVFAVCAALLQTWNVEAAEDGGLVLSKDGKTEYAIKVSAADPVANTAAKELAQHLKLVTGAEFPIAKTEGGNPAFVIAVGPAAAKTLMPDLDLSFAKLGNDGIVMKSAGANLVLTGAEGAKRGTLYAVYEFLEREVGVRWWTSKESCIPKRPTLRISGLDVAYAPKFWSREVFYRDVLQNPVFAARCRSNGEWEKIPASYGGRCSIAGHCHTFFKLLPPEKYFKDHPDWYSEKDGKRTCGEGSQLCLANDEMRKELTENALKWLRKEPDAAMISISQNDGCRIENGCNCAKCLALAKQEGSPSGPLIKFVNQVAEDIEKEFPNVYVETLAYLYTRKPPLTLKPRRNVVIRLCGGSDSASQVGPLSESFKQDVEKWSEISSQLFIWTYVANFHNYLQPYPNLPVLAPYTRFFAEHKTVGLFEQGDGETSCGDFVELRAWLLAHLMWNPSLDEKALINEFMDGYYGPASKPLMQYVELMRSAAERPDSKLLLNGSYAWWLKLEDLIQADRLFDEAARMAKDSPALAAKVRRARIPLDYVWIRQYQWMKATASKEGRLPSLQEMTARYDDFLKAMKDFNERKFAEGTAFTEKGGRFSAPSPKECVNLPASSWFDVQECDFGIWNYGRWCNMVDDPKASNKMAARMPGGIKEWPVYYYVPNVEGLGPLHAYAVIRCEAKPGSLGKERAFTVGVYDVKNKVELANVGDTAGNGEYKTYDLGAYDFSNGSVEVYVSPRGNPEVEAVYVDRIFFVRENR